MNAMTVRELELKRAQLAHRAEELRQKREHTPVTNSRALALYKQIRSLQQRVDDYSRLLATAAETETREPGEAA